MLIATIICRREIARARVLASSVAEHAPAMRVVALVLDAGVEEWTELPLWIADPAYAGMLRADVSRALAAVTDGSRPSSIARSRSAI